MDDEDLAYISDMSHTLFSAVAWMVLIGAVQESQRTGASDPEQLSSFGRDREDEVLSVCDSLRLAAGLPADVVDVVFLEKIWWTVPMAGAGLWLATLSRYMETLVDDLSDPERVSRACSGALDFLSIDVMDVLGRGFVTQGTSLTFDRAATYRLFEDLGRATGVALHVPSVVRLWTVSRLRDRLEPRRGHRDLQDAFRAVARRLA